MEARTLGGQSPSFLIGYRLGRTLIDHASRMLRTSVAPARLIFIEEQKQIGPKKLLILVSCAGQRFFIATTENSVIPVSNLQPVNSSGDGSNPGDPEGDE